MGRRLAALLSATFVFVDAIHNPSPCAGCRRCAEPHGLDDRAEVVVEQDDRGRLAPLPLAR